jgi:hypothetical protein
MKPENKIPLILIQNLLAQYTNDPDPEGVFDAAWYMWKRYCYRHHIHDIPFFAQTRKKGWLTRAQANQFWKYMTGKKRF